MVVIYHFGCTGFKSFVFVVCLYHQLEISLTRQFSKKFIKKINNLLIIIKYEKKKMTVKLCNEDGSDIISYTGHSALVLSY